MFDADGMILRLNSAACELFNTTKAAAVGVPLVSVHSGSDRASGIIESGERLSEFEESVTIDGSQRTLSRTIIPFEDESGAVVGGMEIARDVTQIAVEREKLRHSLPTRIRLWKHSTKIWWRLPTGT